MPLHFWMAPWTLYQHPTPMWKEAMSFNPGKDMIVPGSQELAWPSAEPGGCPPPCKYNVTKHPLMTSRGQQDKTPLEFQLSTHRSVNSPSHEHQKSIFWCHLCTGDTCFTANQLMSAQERLIRYPNLALTTSWCHPLHGDQALFPYILL
jgi:hypothetical protein